MPVVGFAGDGAFGISMNEMTACGRNDWPPITMIIFRNYQWGAEKRLNQELGEPFRSDAMNRPQRPARNRVFKPAVTPASGRTAWNREANFPAFKIFTLTE